MTDSLTLRRLAEIRHCLNCNHEISQDIETQVEEKRGTTTITLVCNNCNTTNKWSSDNKMIRIDEPRAKSYLPNFVILSFVVSGQYFKDYANCLGSIGLGSLSEKQWSRIIDWIEPHVKAIADWSIGEARAEIISREDEERLEIQFDGFFLTRGHYSNNSSATIHDGKTGKVIAFAHRTKRGENSNWAGTSGGAEGDMLAEMLDDLLSAGFKVTKCIMDQDSSCQDILLEKCPESEIVICGNHRSKSFYTDLENTRSEFILCMKRKRLSKICQKKLADYFYQ